MIKAATVYKRPDGFYLHSESQTTAGIWLATAPFLRIALDASSRTMGEAIAEALAGSQYSIEHPTKWSDNPILPMLEIAGVKSWTVFAGDALCVSIQLSQTTLTVTPERNLGPKEGFEPIPGVACILPFPSPNEEIRMALEQAFNRCE